MIKELDIQNHGPVASGECPTVAHKAHQKNDFIADLRTMTAMVRGAWTKSNLRLLVRTGGHPPSAVLRHLCPKQKLPFAPSAHQTHQELFRGSQSFHYFAFQAYCRLMWQSDNSMCNANQVAFVYDKNKICTYWNYDFQDEIWIISNILTWVSQTQKSPQSTNPVISMIKSVFWISVTF